MVLNELGSSVLNVITKFAKTRLTTNEAVNALVDEFIGVLEAADVPTRTLEPMRKSMTTKILGDPAIMEGRANTQQVVQRIVVQELVSMLSPDRPPFRPVRNRANVIMFVGLQGAGKTTTCVKFGAYYKRKGWRVGLVCCDTFRTGAFDQLKQNCTAVKLPFYGSYSEKDPVQIAQDGVKHFLSLNFELIILDTSGRHRQEEALFTEMKLIDNAVQPHDHVFVLDSSIGQAAYEQADAFSNAVEIGSVILTKLDGHSRGGGALAAVSATKAPIVFLGTGEKIEDLEFFDPSRFVSVMLGYGDIMGLHEAMQGGNIDHKAHIQTVVRMLHNHFSFRDFKEQLKNLNKMGPLQKIASMVPGFSQMAASGDLDMDSEVKQLQIFNTIMDSMAAKELDSNTEILKKEGEDKFRSRAKRIAIGSGYTVEEVLEFFDKAAEFSEMFGKMGRKLKSPGALQELFSSMNMNPQMMQQMMSGLGSLQNMPEMADLAKNMGMKMPGNLNMQQIQQMASGMGGMSAGQLKKLQQIQKSKMSK
ncbi:putative signal peptide binding domain protein/ SRP GTPase [Giardia duodenalis assemblage B]|uniref:signal-recognition-particle GTPase n=1 Tax=Giardia duodenalis assemblage B TaxID=1394984 RepID=A0A132NRD6_GIAIN|nr:putative signal peptide binding domain protein/ SRP GTPase [Giardia intestinalis assemblage B]